MNYQDFQRLFAAGYNPAQFTQSSSSMMPPYRFPDWMLQNLHSASLRPHGSLFSQSFIQHNGARSTFQNNSSGQSQLRIPERVNKSTAENRTSNIKTQNRDSSDNKSENERTSKSNEMKRKKENADSTVVEENTRKGTKRRLEDVEKELIEDNKYRRLNHETSGKTVHSLPSTPVQQQNYTSPDPSPINLRPNTANSRYGLSKPSTSQSKPPAYVDDDDDDDSSDISSADEGEEDEEEVVDEGDIQSSNRELSSQILDYQQRNVQRREDIEKKEVLRYNLEASIRRLYPGCRLCLVGSSLNGFGNRKSDADMCLLVPNAGASKINAQNILVAINRYFCKAQNMFIGRPFVIFAKVPILRFTDRRTHIECDININNTVGIRNTCLLYLYSKMDDRVVPLVMVIKQWAKASNINDASQGTLSSYSLVLMVLYYLQAQCNPPVIPVIQQIDKSINISQNIYDVMSRLGSRTIPSNLRFQSKNKSDLGTLFRGFFKFFATFNFREKVMSARLGAMTNLFPSWRRQYIHIEEPFELVNTARAVHKQPKFDQIVAAIKNMNRVLVTQKNINFDAILNGVNSTPLDNSPLVGRKNKRGAAYRKGRSKFAEERRMYRKTKRKLKEERTKKALKWLDERDARAANQNR